MAKIRNVDIERLNGEVLPERTVLSAVPMDGGSSVAGCGVSGNLSQGNAVSGSVFGFAAGNNQCGWTNTAGNATGLSLGTLTL